MSRDEYLQIKIEEEEKWLHTNYYSTKAIILNLITLGMYGKIQCGNYMRRVGLL